MTIYLQSKLSVSAFFSFKIMLFVAYLTFSTSVLSEDISIEYKVKAGYLYNFTKFVYWSETDLETFNLCIVGKDSFGTLIQSIEQKKALGKPIHLFRYSYSQKSLSHCQMIFFADSKYVDYLISSLNFNNILTIGEGENFVKNGGMLAFVVKNNKVKLQISLNTLKKNNLNVSAKLLEVAEIIEGER